MTSDLNCENLAKEINDIIDLYFDRVPFNKLLGLKTQSLSPQKVCFRLEYREELIGNYMLGILHGGVISSVLDNTGGAMALVGTLIRNADQSQTEKAKRISRLGTIDLRIDFLRPGRGQYFIAEGSILRIGNKVAVTRMELINDQAELLAVGTGTYLCG